ncbi:MAG: DUF364 domain-containing protein [Gammaproteobacteria bacterium]
MPVLPELLAQTGKIAAAFDVPRVRRVYIPDPRPHENRHTEFGVVELEDGSAGLYYAWLGDSQKSMVRRFHAEQFSGVPPTEIISLLEGDNDADRSLGMAAVNAITHSFWRRSGYRPEEAGDSMGALAPDTEDHVGMVGYFPSLVDRLRRQGIRVTVIEKKSRFADAGEEYVTITDSPAGLEACNKILCTASTLLNDSLDEILQHCRDAETIVVVGPTAGFLPDPLFRRNVTALGGTEILDAEATIDNLRNDRGLADSTHKYLIPRTSYPGLDTLLSRLNI